MSAHIDFTHCSVADSGSLLPKNNSQQWHFTWKPLILGAYTMNLSSSLCCGNNSPPARSLGAISSIHCHHHNLTWCGNYAMKSFFSHSTLFGACCRTEQLYGFDRFSKRVNQSMIENCHQVWFFKWKYYTSLDRIITSLGNKVFFFFLLFFSFFYLLSFCCKEIQFDYMLLYLCITQHLKENFKLC